MVALLKAIPGLLLILKLVTNIFTNWKAKRDARRELEGEIAKQEVKAANAVTEIMAERRPDDDAARRMRDGSF